MNVSTEQYKDIYSTVACPKCGRGTGEPCRTTRAMSEFGYQFRSPQPHKARVEAYRKRQ